VFSIRNGESRQSCSRCEPLTERRLVYTDGMDGSPDSGHAAQVLLLDIDGARVALLNTHLKWDAPQTPPHHQYGLRQAQLAVEALRQETSTIQMICGDLNATPGGSPINFLLDAGFDYTHRTLSVGLHLQLESKRQAD